MVRKKSETSTAMEATTTARVVETPTPTVPPTGGEGQAGRDVPAEEELGRGLTSQTRTPGALVGLAPVETEAQEIAARVGLETAVYRRSVAEGNSPNFR